MGEQELAKRLAEDDPGSMRRGEVWWADLAAYRPALSPVALCCPGTERTPSAISR